LVLANELEVSLSKIEEKHEKTDNDLTKART